MIRGSREIEDALLKHLGVKRNGLYYIYKVYTPLKKSVYVILTNTH